MARQSLRENLLEAGFQTIWNSGYSAAGVRDIVAAAGARPGSFTNHFASKEEFAGEVLERYFAYVSGLVEKALAQDGTPPAGRLRRYLDVITSKLEAHDWARGCMIGNLSLETAVQSEPLRRRLVDIFERWGQPFAACIAEGQAAGEITNAFDAEDLADFLLSSWQGAMLRMKVERNPEPLERFKKIIFGTVFEKETAR
ncbi:TetR family transcriptional regulator C-terminal domain-containing protein [Mesorhizobium sp. VK22B]|uniref:TetR family transcriptional regulator C-terminal domain-containing protein n=1 Tax=Mesorhizobium captivum TaxID=3072319 RepID=A0ABU4Z529_9HYPH|nr:TetR family transcriptional regulator C-terminal domain-containing protein [Mesorhizobium sp. VK22B]MDX8494383.1 TetR family transcriptional regulator C-terminal domain-containing protein [Mesorhizobium sp. VK22B]